MFITKMSLPRRTVLRGMGITLAMPLLEAMVPAATALAGTAANAPRRAGFVYVPHGKIMDQWTPATEGSGFEFTPILKPLEPFRDSLVVVSNLARPGAPSTFNHAVASSAWLTGALPKQTEGEDYRVGTTIDQVVASQIGQDTPFPSLELATEDFTGYIGACAIGYSCAYMNTISWATPTSPLPMEVNPRVLFERMFGRAGTRAQRLMRMQENRSILDEITQDANELQRNVGANDRVRLVEYLEDIREIERRIQGSEARNSTEVAAPPDAPVGVPESYAEHVGLMFDMMTVAYQADLTRVFSFMLARDLSMRTYPEIDEPEPHHAISHHGNKADKMALHAKLNTYHVQLFAKFVEKLRTTPDGDGSLLDHTLVFYGSGMSNGNIHGADPLPLLALGGLAGAGNRHIKLAPHTPLGNMWLGVAEKFGSSLDNFGASTGRVEL
jgi:hypothetical protein